MVEIDLFAYSKMTIHVIFLVMSFCFFAKIPTYDCFQRRPINDCRMMFSGKFRFGNKNHLKKVNASYLNINKDHHKQKTPKMFSAHLNTYSQRQIFLTYGEVISRNKPG